MWVPVWLYDSDGRPMYYVVVLTPFTPKVAYAGLTFDWDATRQRYEKEEYTCPYFTAAPGGPVEVSVPEARPAGIMPAAPSSPIPSTVSEMRSFLLDGIARLLSHTWFVQGTDATVLHALERLYLNDDEVVGKVLASLKQLLGETKEELVTRGKKKMAKTKKAIDWQAVLAKLNDLVSKLPAVAALVEQIVQVLEEPAPAPPANYTAGPQCCHEDLCCHLLEHLGCQQEDLAHALVTNLHLQVELEKCCPDGPPDGPPEGI